MNLTHLLLAVFMLLTGTINTIVLKTQDSFEDVPGMHGNVHPFYHPAFQSAAMFLGESLCFIVYVIYQKRKGEEVGFRLRDFSLFAVPALCDCIGTTFMNLGLILTYASVFQMLRGFLVVFTGTFSVIFLKRKLRMHHWGGIAFILCGTAIVGVSSFIAPANDSAKKPPDPALGAVFILIAQVFTAIQFIIEEKFVNAKNVHALQAVGYEGLWGLLILIIMLPILNVIPGNDNGYFQNTLDAFIQVGNNGALAAAVVGGVFSVAFFNFFGISVTKFLSSSHRATIDAMRTIFVWIFFLAAQEEQFNALQLAGFFVLAFGSFTYNEIVLMRCSKYDVALTDSMSAGDVAEEHQKLIQKPADKTVNGFGSDE